MDRPASQALHVAELSVPANVPALQSSQASDRDPDLPVSFFYFFKQFRRLQWNKKQHLGTRKKIVLWVSIVLQHTSCPPGRWCN